MVRQAGINGQSSRDQWSDRQGKASRANDERSATCIMGWEEQCSDEGGAVRECVMMSAVM